MNDQKSSEKPKESKGGKRQVNAIVRLRKMLKEEYQWAYENQMHEIENQNEKEISWNRGYRNALKQVAKIIGVELTIAT